VLKPLSFLVLLLGPAACAQAPPPPIAPAAIVFHEPEIPADPLELASGTAEPVQDVSQRAAILKLLAEARARFNVRAYAYDLKTSFNALGSSSSDGSWQLEDSSPGRAIYRWTAQGPSYSAINLFLNGVLYSNQPATAMPLRLAQVRGAIFWVFPLGGPQASLRTAAGSLNGASLNCILISRGARTGREPGARHWGESEYCIDPASGVLVTYSPVPGLYVLYDYSAAIHFHDRVIPGKFTITEKGQPVIEAQVLGVSDAQASDHASFGAAGLSAVGVGPLSTPAWHLTRTIFTSTPNANAALQIVVIHGMLSAARRLTDLEVVSSSNPGLVQAALDQAAQWQNWQPEEQPGATPQSHEVFFTMMFAGPHA
jgi:hypothetical protein